MDLKDLIPSFGRKSVPVKHEDEHPFVSLQREMNRLLDGFVQSWDPDAPDRFSGFSPRIDMTEDEKSIKVSAELPGITDKDIEVSLSHDSLTIRGEKKSGKEERRQNYFYAERSFGSFNRTIPIPREIETDKVQAQFKKGILTVTMPKTTAAVKEARKIAVTAE